MLDHDEKGSEEFADAEQMADWRIEADDDACGS
jgi:hypothetical protein